MTNKELAQKILNVLNLQIEDSEMADVFKKEFDNDFIWYPYYLASIWHNDLKEWCEAVLEDKTEEDVFGKSDDFSIE